MTTKQRNAQTAAAAKREQRAVAHAIQQARHAARRNAIAIYEAAEQAWHDGGMIGPQPCNPRYRDFSLFPENAPSRNGAGRNACYTS